MDVEQDAHQFGDAKARMRVVELNGRTRGQEMKIAIGFDVPMQQILQRGRDEEIFLAQTELETRGRRIVRVEELADCFGTSLLRKRTQMVAAVERVEAKRIGRTRGPKPQGIYVATSPSHDRRVIGHGLDRLAWMPDGSGG